MLAAVRMADDGADGAASSCSGSSNHGGDEGRLPLELACVDLGADSVQHAFSLLGDDGWDVPASLQPARTLWCAARHRGGQPEQPLVHSARGVGRVRGATPELLQAVVGDAEFRAFWSHGEGRTLRHVIVPDQLWVFEERISMSVPFTHPRDFVYIATQAELAGGTKLHIEHSIEHSACKPVEPCVRGYRFMAVSFSPVGHGSRDASVRSSSCQSVSWSAPAGKGGTGVAPSRDDETDDRDEVEVAIVLQMDLGPMPGPFTKNYVLEAVELVHAQADGRRRQ